MSRGLWPPVTLAIAEQDHHPGGKGALRHRGRRWCGLRETEVITGEGWRGGWAIQFEQGLQRGPDAPADGGAPLWLQAVNGSRYGFPVGGGRLYDSGAPPSPSQMPRVYPRVCGGTFLEDSTHEMAGGLSPRVRGNPPSGQ